MLLLDGEADDDDDDEDDELPLPTLLPEDDDVENFLVNIRALTEERSLPPLCPPPLLLSALVMMLGLTL